MKISSAELCKRYRGLSKVKPVSGKYLDFNLYQALEDNNISLEDFAKQVGLSYKHLRGIANIQKFTSVLRVQLIESSLINNYHIDIEKYRFPKEEEPKIQQVLDVFDPASNGVCTRTSCQFYREDGCCINNYFSKVDSELDAIRDAIESVSFALGNVLGIVMSINEDQKTTNAMSVVNNHIQNQDEPLKYISALMDKMKNLEKELESEGIENVGKKSEA